MAASIPSDHGAEHVAPLLWTPSSGGVRESSLGAAARSSGPAREIAEPAGNAILAALCILVFAAGLSTLWSPLLNATVISGYEIVFVLVYVILSRLSPGTAAGPKTNPIVVIAVAAWFGSVTFSLVASPYDMLGEGPGLLRYEQTAAHLAFFVAVREFFGRYRVSVHWALLAIPASCLAVVVLAAYLLLGLDQFDTDAGIRWFHDPPFNAHIRHTGYQVTAGAAVLIAFFAAGHRVPVARAPLWLALTILLAFLFWLGGRGSALSVLAAFILLAIVLRIMGEKSRGLWLACASSAALGLIFSDSLAVFDWNGVIDRIAAQSAGPAGGQDLNQFGSGRVDLWRTSWESVRDHLPFGLGPNGYWFMPNRIYGVQPHSFLVQFILEWGLVGGLLFLGLLLYGFWRGFLAHVVGARGALDISSLSAGTAIVALTVHGLVDGTYYHPQPSLYLALAFAIWTLPRRSEVGTLPKTEVPRGGYPPCCGIAIS